MLTRMQQIHFPLQFDTKFIKHENNTVISKNSQHNRDQHTWVKTQTFFNQEGKRYKQCHRWGNEPYNSL